MMNAKEARELTDSALPVLLDEIGKQIEEQAKRGQNMIIPGCFVCLTEDAMAKVREALEAMGYKVTSDAVTW